VFVTAPGVAYLFLVRPQVFLMSLTNLKLAASQSEAWKSSVLDESHDYPEGLLVIDGQLNLTIGNEAIIIHAGELFVVPGGVAHAVAPGSAGTLIIFDA
jgi:quercetin dioxygenase-like cupin family protein